MMPAPTTRTALHGSRCACRQCQPRHPGDHAALARRARAIGRWLFALAIAAGMLHLGERVAYGLQRCQLTYCEGGPHR